MSRYSRFSSDCPNLHSCIAQVHPQSRGNQFAWGVRTSLEGGMGYSGCSIIWMFGCFAGHETSAGGLDMVAPLSTYEKRQVRSVLNLCRMLPHVMS